MLYRRRRLLYDPTTRTLGDKLFRLARLAPGDVKAIELIVDDCLRHRWPSALDPLGRGDHPHGPHPVKPKVRWKT